MNLVSKLFVVLFTRPWQIIANLRLIFITKYLPDKFFLSCQFRAFTGKKMNWKNPQTFSEKIQWLKIYGRRPEYTTMVDKYAVKEYVTDLIGEEYIIPCLGFWNRFDDIDFSKLPDRFVLKCTHDSASVVICRDKSTFDYKQAKRKLERALRINYFHKTREWVYKDVPRRIIAEEYMEDFASKQLMDYKIFNFNGVPKFIQLDFDRFTNHRRNIYSLDWCLQDFQLLYPTAPSRIIPRPDSLAEMLELAGKLSEGIPFCRTDFYIINNSVKFGEITFYPGAGYEKFTPEEWDFTFGGMIKLPPKKL